MTTNGGLNPIAISVSGKKKLTIMPSKHGRKSIISSGHSCIYNGENLILINSKCAISCSVICNVDANLGFCSPHGTLTSD